MRRRKMISLIVLLLAPVAASAEPVNIGHLETSDDTGISSWQFWTCNKSGPTMHCQIVQTFINHEIEPAQRDAAIRDKLRQLTPDTFRQQMGDTCKNSEQMRRFVADKLATGKKPDGSLLAKSETADMRATFDTMAAACKNPSAETIRAMVEQGIDQSTRTCVVTNLSSEDTLHWNDVMKEWESRSAETGPCGGVVETRMHNDPTAKLFWLSEEHHLFTRPSGQLPDGRSCSILPADKTYHFTWRAAQNTADCTYIKNSMN